MDLAGDENLAGKVLIDVSNPLDFSHGFPPALSVPSTDSIAERIQRAHPQAKVVKTLNTVTAPLMVDPSRVPGEHNMFVAGDDADAKATVTELLGTFGWSAERVIDLGGIVSARGLEHYVLFWVHVRIAFGTSDFNIDVKR
jgi:predicted dinucleotide-binding enzyme